MEPKRNNLVRKYRDIHGDMESCPLRRRLSLQTVSVLEERLTLTEDKLKECLHHQAHMARELEQSRARPRRAESGSPDDFP